MNKQLFNNHSKSTDTLNEAGGKAYALTPKQALAQLVSTGTLNHTFYVDANTQLDQILATATKVDSEFLAKVAVYGRHHSRMKDVPVLLLALLATREDGQPLFKAVFNQVVDNGKQLRNFVQIMRSGVVGRKSLGSLAKKQVNEWLADASDYRYVSANIGNSPTLGDVLRMTHPRPDDERQEALYQWTLGRDYKLENLPTLVQQLVAFQADNSQPLPDVPLQMLMSLDLTTAHWATIAKNGNWQMLRMNLNTFARHGVFGVDGMSEIIADKLADATAVRKSGVFPYQLYTTWSALDSKVPSVVKDALANAMTTALANVPVLDGNIVVAVDVSGSMSSPVTGYRRGATSVVRCVDAAALFAAAIKKANPTARIMPFDTELRMVKSLEALKTSAQVKALAKQAEQTVPNSMMQKIAQSRLFRQQKADEKLAKQPSIPTTPAPPVDIDVFALATELASLCGGGTAVSIPLERLNQENANVDVMIYFSDNESWADPHYGRGTQMMAQWDKLKKRNPNAKLICVDVQPYTHSQAREREDVLNVGGFGDEVFRMIDLFAKGQLQADHWVGKVDKIVLPTS
ncbi:MULTISPECIES: RNA-binding protein [unclassified Moraxella]|uniref:RNA-binding protein n=1 Tax=unclassified Moraxella TaxID=2685852 RepID=UPI003AF4DF44